MPFNLNAKKLIYWCAKSLVACGFPSPPSTNNSSQEGKYCNDYPYLFSGDVSQLSDKLSASLYERHLSAKELFSLRNYNLVVSALCATAYRILYTFSFIAFLIFGLNIVNRVLLAVLFVGTMLLGGELQLLNKMFLYSLNKKYIETMCILETHYLYQDLIDDKVLIRKKARDSVKRKIKKLSRLIYIFGKHNQDKSSFFQALSKDIFNKIDWLNKPRFTTIKDLQEYFTKVEDYLTLGVIGEMQIEEHLLQKRNWKKMSDAIDKSFLIIEKLLSLFERFVAIYRKIK